MYNMMWLRCMLWIPSYAGCIVWERPEPLLLMNDLTVLRSCSSYSLP